jgi:hypothetical protein
MECTRFAYRTLPKTKTRGINIEPRGHRPRLDIIHYVQELHFSKSQKNACMTLTNG